MAALNIDRFSGLAPRLNSKRLPAGVAQIALDCDLDNQTLRPWRTGKLAHKADKNVLGFIRTKAPTCCWLTWDKCVDVVYPYTPSCPFVIVSNDGEYPKIATEEDACAGEWCRLGVPCPELAPIAQPDTTIAANRNTAYRAYRYTFVNKYGQEGGGSAPSQVFDCDEDGQSVTVTNFDVPDPEWCVTTIRLYRLETPYETGLENSNPQNTEYFFVDEFPVTQPFYVDTVPAIKLGGPAGPNVFTNDEYLPAPADLHSLVSLENGRLAGISGNQIWMCSPNQPHAWLIRYTKMALDKPIALAAVASQLYCATDGRPYTIDGRNDCQGDGCQAVLRTRVPLPCVSKRSMVADSGMIYYASTEGLVSITGTAVRVISQTHLSARDWQALHPNLMIGAWRNGYYHGYSDNAGIRFRSLEGEFARPEDIIYTQLSERPQALWRADDGELYYAIGDEIYQWNAGDRFKDYHWRSTRIYFPRRTTLTTAMLEWPKLSGRLEFTMYTDYGAVQQRGVDESSEIRLTGAANAAFVAFEFKGTREVAQITAGTSYAERIRAEQQRAA
jgi:hypothetical protein